MRASFVGRISGALLALVLSALPAAAQTGTLVGSVVDAQTGAPVPGAQVDVLRGTTSTASVLADAQGRFRAQLPVGTYALVGTSVGYTVVRVDGVTVLAGQTTNAVVEMTSTIYELAPITVTAGRQEENVISAVSNVVTVGAEKIEDRTALTPVEHVKALPGVDVVQTGLTSSNVVARGFNNVFSGALLVLTDNRYAFVPSLRFNAHNMIPTNQFDVERMEVLLGPAASLYGPNSASGVMHIITSSPIDAPGTKISLAGGERDVVFGQFRTAFKFNENAGLKFSGQYFQGTEWECRESPTDAPEDTCDPAEYSARAGNPALADRDYDLERYGGEARFDYRTDGGAEIILNAGLNNLGSSIEMTGIGAGQAIDWKYSYAQARFRSGRFFAQAFLNQSNAGETFLYRTGQEVVDKSRMMVGQVQQGFALGESLDFIAGLDLQRTDPRTEGTINGRNEDDDQIDEVGGYLHSETRLSENLKLVAALRVDYHNRLEDLVYSPRAALVFEPAENQAFRLTYNRAFSTPSTNNLFLDIVAGRIPVGPSGYDLRTRGTPESGFTFNDTCAGGVGGYCMYTPFAPQLGQIPANALPLWNDLIAVVLNSAGAGALLPALQNPGAAPGDPAVNSMLRRFNQEQLSFVPDPDGPEAIDRIRPTIYNSFEVGYKGILGGRLLVSADLYSQQIRDFVGPLRTETPSIFFEPGSVQAFVLARLGPLIQGGQVTQAQATAIIQGMASIPVGTVAPDQGDNSDIILAYRNFGDVDLWGADFSFQFLATDRLSLTGTYSRVSDECFDFNNDGSCSSSGDIALNAPQNKGSVGFRWDDVTTGVTFDARARYTDGFPMNSGVYIGEVDSYTAVDANIAYRLPWAPGATVGLTATNIFDDVHREFVGAPMVGRMLLARLQYEF
ncbi:MAG TPA: TonB-dependent receptor [Longimicrobiales bacterium]|nr:TonB-dependent receptor [Longimicrobiales bacterium]